MHRRILPIALFLLAFASAAGAQGRAELLLSDAPQPEGRRCSILRRLNAAQQQVVDSASLRQALAAEAGLPAEGSVLYSVRMDVDGTPAWVRPIDPALAPEIEGRVQALVRASLREVKAPDAWSVRVRVTLGAAPEVRVGRSEVCPAAFAEVPRTERVTRTEIVSARELSEMQRAGPSEVRVLVGPTGQVMEVRLAQSSGSRTQDDSMLDMARRGRYRPELVDGFPVAGWFTINTRTR